MVRARSTSPVSETHLLLLRHVRTNWWLIPEWTLRGVCLMMVSH